MAKLPQVPMTTASNVAVTVQSPVTLPVVKVLVPAPVAVPPQPLAPLLLMLRVRKLTLVGTAVQVVAVPEVTAALVLPVVEPVGKQLSVPPVPALAVTVYWRAALQDVLAPVLVPKQVQLKVVALSVTAGVEASPHKLALGRVTKALPLPPLAPQTPADFSRKVAVTALFACTLVIEQVAPVQSPLKTLKM